MPDHFIFTRDDVLSMLDTLLQTGADAWWDDLFADRSKPCPFFTEWPDENLAEWFNAGLLAPGRVLELGCGNGRNATYLAGLGCSVDAVDFSVQAIQWARERANRASAPVAFQRCSIFDAQFTDGSYDLVYDSGCFHHVPPPHTVVAHARRRARLGVAEVLRQHHRLARMRLMRITHRTPPPPPSLVFPHDLRHPRRCHAGQEVVDGTSAGQVQRRGRRGDAATDSERVDQASWRFAAALCAGAPLGAALAAHPDCDATPVLADFLARGRFIDFSLAPYEDGIDLSEDLP